jgi:hypothetical protein
MSRGDSIFMYNDEPRYSLFLLETYLEGYGTDLTKKAFEYAGTFDTLEKAKEEQSKYDLKTIILPSY